MLILWETCASDEENGCGACTSRHLTNAVATSAEHECSANCDGCMAGLAEMYQDYVDGKKEIREINMELHDDKKKEIINELIERQEQREDNLKNMFHVFFSLKEDSASKEEIRDRILSGGKITGTNMVVMVCAIVIASIGLNTDSIAVIIGAMLISPLMGSILAVAYGTASNNLYLIKKHLIGFGFQIMFSVGAATVYFWLSPVKDVTSQLLARTSPGLFDVLIAIAGGVAGIVGQTRVDKANNIIPGVAIATALMPPLCTCGYSIANQNWEMLVGALYLFIINAYFIYVSSGVMLAILGTPLAEAMSPERKKRLKRKMFRNTFLVLLPIIAVTFSFIK